MITRIEVDGFKSLKDFNLDLNTGLNILVGPNGAGKTNIIIFFEFISNIVSNQVGNAISNVGGAGSIFQKIGKETYNDTIKCVIYGSYEIDADKYAAYEYSFQIKISFAKDEVFFTNQDLKLKLTHKFWNNPESPGYPQKWDADISYSFQENGISKLFIKEIDKDKIKPRFIKAEKQKELESILTEFFSSPDPAYNSIIGSTIRILGEEFYPILIDLRGGETFNIIPSKVRELEDSATPPGIKKDGSGLATTLYAMKKGRSITDLNSVNILIFRADTKRTFNPDLLNKIIYYLKLANPTITNLNVENDPFNNKVVIRVFIQNGDSESVLPLSAMSDGTIKWLTLITAILTSKTIFSIEEPENFLHPWMQAEIANIMRNHLEEKKSHAFVLMTTHSESLINHARPEEIIIVDLNEGKTRARRIADIDLIRDGIAHSGFGLGHFYISNSLINE